MNRFSKAALAIVAAVSLLLAGAQGASAGGKDFVPISVSAGSTAHPSHLGARKGAGLVCPPDGCYYYASAQQSGMSPGVKSMAADVTIDDPWMSSCCAYHTLVEMTLQNSISPLDSVIEWGWTRDNTGLYADTKPRLFMSIFVDGVWGGYNNGCVDYTGNSVNLGQDLTADLNTEQPMGIQYAAATGPSNPARWWLYYKNNPVCSVPASSIPDLNSGASAMQVFGEVDAKDDHPCTDMGGNPASLPTSTTYTSRFSSVTYDASAPAVSLTPVALNPTWYGAVLKSGSVRTLNFGGPSGC